MTPKDFAYCKSCKYCSTSHNSAMSNASCCYLEMTGRARSLICPAGVGCTERVKIKGRRSQIRHDLTSNAAAIGLRKQDYRKIDREKARKLYDEGLSDPQIAKHFNCSAPAVAFWRKAYGLPPNLKPHAPRGKEKTDGE